MVDSQNPLSPHNSSQAEADPYERSLRWILQGIGQDLQPAERQDLQLIETCCRTLMLEGLNKLPQMEPVELKTWASYLQSCQDPETGLFHDPTSGDHPPEGRQGGTMIQAYQSTYLALQALDALGMKALHRLKFLDWLHDEQTIFGWLNELDVPRNPQDNETVVSVLSFLIYEVEVEDDPLGTFRYHQILDWLESVRGKKSGVWGEKNASFWMDAVVNTSRFSAFYQYVHRPVQKITRIMDLVLELQQVDGEEQGAIRGSVGECLLAIQLLSALSSRTHYRGEEIQQVLIRTALAIRNRQLEDGSFAISQPASMQTSESILLPTWKIDMQTGPLWVTWLSLLALASIESVLQKDMPGLPRWKFRRWPWLGNQPDVRGLDEHKRRVLPLWVRPGVHPSGGAAPGLEPAPKISVVIPCYNMGEYLPEAVDSVLMQTCQDFEIIVMDDGSTDDVTRDILANFTRPKMRILRQVNRGVAAARNACIEQARSSYICCLDADDRLMPEYFEKTTQILDNDPAVGLVTSQYRVFDERDNIVTFESCKLPEILAENRAMVSSVFRKEAWAAAGGFFEGFSLSGFEDWDLWISLLEQGWKAEVIDDILFEYRIRPDSMYKDIIRNPESLRMLLHEIIRRHRSSYDRFFAEVIVEKGAQNARLLGWIAEQEQSIAWWQGQASNWQQLADERKQMIEELKNWISELQEGKTWLEDQIVHWQQTAADREQSIHHLEASIAELVTAQPLPEDLPDTPRKGFWADLRKLFRLDKSSSSSMAGKIEEKDK